MRFSIIVPVYNAKAFLPGCVESICRDDGNDWELILVNDGSSDDSGILCQQFAARDRRIRVIHQTNMGPGGARNMGLRQAQGEYVWFVDSDDSILPGALDTLREACDRFSADIFSFDYLQEEGKGQLRPVAASMGIPDRPFSLQEQPEFLRSMPAVWLRLWKRSLFAEHKIEFPDRAFYGEDLQTSVKLFALAQSIVILRRPLYCYCDRPGSLMNQVSESRNRHMLEAFADLTQWFEQHSLRSVYEQQLTALAVEHLLLATTVRVAKGNPLSPFLPEIRQFIDEHYPAWKTCTYVRQMSGTKRLALFLVEHRRYRVLQILFRLKG